MLIRFILLKYLRFDKNQPFIMATAILAFLGIAIGVMVLIVAMAIMNGMSAEFKERLFTMNYPLTIHATSSDMIEEQTLLELERRFKDLRFSPYIRTQVVYKNKSLMKAAIIFGVDFAREGVVNKTIAKALEEYAGKRHVVDAAKTSEAKGEVDRAKVDSMNETSVESKTHSINQTSVESKTHSTNRANLVERKTHSTNENDVESKTHSTKTHSTKGVKKAAQTPNLKAALSTLPSFPLLLGATLKSELFIHSRARAYFMQLSPIGLALAPTIKGFDVFGSFHSGLNVYDANYSFTTIEALSAILDYKEGLYEGIHVFSKSPQSDKPRLIAALNEIAPNMTMVTGWWESNKNFFAAMELEKHTLFIILMLIILMAALNIISSALMLIMQRRGEIALLLSMGASREEIFKIFFYLGNVIGIAGVAFGALLSFVVMYVLDTFPIITLPADVYGISKLPLALAPTDLALTLVGGVFITLVSSYYPARNASNIDTLKVLRNE